MSMDVVCGKQKPGDPSLYCPKSPKFGKAEDRWMPLPHEGPCEFTEVNWKKRAEGLVEERMPLLAERRSLQSKIDSAETKLKAILDSCDFCKGGDCNVTEHNVMASIIENFHT
jgi:hypothetical protein